MTPDPQVVMIGELRSTPAAAKVALSASGDLSDPASSAPADGRSSAPGIWPTLTTGHGSGLRASKRSAGRASTTLAEPIGERRLHVFEIRHETGLETRRKDFRLGRRLAHLHRMPGGDPRRQAAVENPDPLAAENAEHPPGARRGQHSVAVVDDDAVALADAERADRARERLGVGQHVRQRRRMIGDRVDVEIGRAGDMLLEKLRPAVALRRRQIPGGVENDEVARPEVRGEPVDLDERRRRWGGVHFRGDLHGGWRGERYRPICARWRRKASASTQATIASPTGAARMPTQGSCRPLVTISVSSPARVTVRRGDRIEDVGLTAKRATIGWPVEMPPRIPPAWLERNRGRPSLPARISSAFSSPRQRRRGEAVADLDPLDGVDAHQRARELGVELAVDRRAPAGRNALGDDLDHRADRGAGLAHLVEMVGEAAPPPRRRAEERIAGDLVPVPARAVDLQLAHLDQRAANRSRPGTTLRAIAPAATRAAVSRAEERPPPR